MFMPRWVVMLDRAVRRGRVRGCLSTDLKDVGEEHPRQRE